MSRRKPTAPTERPILFRDDMVRAILDDRKTVTRRVGPTWAGVQPGTRLWVREAHVIVHGRAWSGLPCRQREGAGVEWAFYRTGFDHTPPSRWRPSIHMPRWACRLELDVVSVTEQHGRGCGRQGASLCMCAWRGCTPLPDLDDAEAIREGFATRSDFLVAWGRMHADHRGPVYRVEFRRLERT